MFERTNTQKTIINTMMTSLLLGAAIYFAVSISQASALANSAGNKSVSIIGIKVLDIFKNPAGDGTFNAGISINYNGIAMYFGLVLIIGLLVGLFKSKFSNNK